MPAPNELDLLCQGRHADPFSVLGPQLDAQGARVVRAFFPGARGATLLSAGAAAIPMLLRHPDGVFEAPHPSQAAYQLQVTWPDGAVQTLHDPYRFGLVLGELDA